MTNRASCLPELTLRAGLHDECDMALTRPQRTVWRERQSSRLSRSDAATLYVTHCTWPITDTQNKPSGGGWKLPEKAVSEQVLQNMLKLSGERGVGTITEYPMLVTETSTGAHAQWSLPVMALNADNLINTVNSMLLIQGPRQSS